MGKIREHEGKDVVKGIVAQNGEVTLASHIESDKKEYEKGEAILIWINVTNMGEAIFIEFPTTKRREIVVESKDKKIYSWSKDKLFAQAITPLFIQKNESKSLLSITWNQVDNEGKDIESGLYTVHGIMANYYYQGVIYPEISSPPLQIRII